jgi:hypothetical protein
LVYQNQRAKPDIPIDNPLRSFCPVCKEVEWRTSESCWHCASNVRQLWDAHEHYMKIQAIKENRKKWNNRGWLAMVLGGSLLLGSNYFGINLPGYAYAVAACVALGGYAIMSNNV